ncbi:hypothetical protein NSS79_15455 [Paenibacillus sp. FSL L8-0436]|uniref:hypothetical protein n=1 Tax=Paenibacillus sp. FSL L8-0436 TaxID=2954686 RepID=UPI003158DF88
MKKAVAGFIAGIVFMIGAQAFGDSISKIGKKIQTELSVTVDGKKLNAPAIAVDGTSYAPVRAIGEATGYDVSVSGKSIALKKESANVTSTNETTQPAASAPVPTPNENTSQATINKLVALNGKIASKAADIGFTEAQLKDDPNNADLKAKLEKYKAEYADLLAQKAALEQEELNK